MGKRCFSCYKNPLLLSSPSTLLKRCLQCSATASFHLLASRTAPAQQSVGDSTPGVTQASPETVVQGHCVEWELSLWVSHCDIMPWDTGLHGTCHHTASPTFGFSTSRAAPLGTPGCCTGGPACTSQLILPSWPHRSSWNLGHNVH